MVVATSGRVGVHSIFNCSQTSGEIGMGYRSVVVMWSYWPPVRRGTQDDPIDDQCIVDSLVEAVTKSVVLQKEHGAQLRYVSVSLRIV